MGETRRFLNAEGGAVTLDWLVLAAGLVSLAVTAVVVVGTDAVQALESAEEPLAAQGAAAGGMAARSATRGADEPHVRYYPDTPDFAAAAMEASAVGGTGPGVAIDDPADRGGQGAFEPAIAEPAAGVGAAPTLGAPRLATAVSPDVSVTATGTADAGDCAGVDGDNPWLAASLRKAKGCAENVEPVAGAKSASQTP